MKGFHVHQFFALDPGSGRPVAVARYEEVSSQAAKEVIAHEKLEQATSWEMWLANSPLSALSLTEPNEKVAEAYSLGARDALNVVRAAFEMPPLPSNERDQED